jgi:site-specific DNA-methyltransferase (adenine-specific)/adenine-specific DNA-methyltransferase
MHKLQSIEKAKGRAMLVWAGKKPLESIEYYPAQEKEIYGDKKSSDFNKLFWGDNLQVLAHLLKEYRGKVDLIYIDPPFDSKADYIRKIQFKGEKVEGENHSLLEEKQYGDIWEKDEYLQFMYERLLILKELLSEKGAIYLHCDWHKNSHLRLTMDEVFGEDNFVNEIVWSYRSGGASRKESLPRKHDTILFYRKTNNFEVNTQTERQYLEKSFMGSLQDEQGRFYVDTILRDVFEGLINTVNKDGKIITFNTRPVLNLSSERTDYPTQKPEGLLELLIDIASKKNDLVLDCFCGSGTTMAVAQKLGRRWIGCDINLGAIQTSTKRLNQIIKEQKSKSGFKVLNVNEYTAFKNELEAKEIVMEMYGVEEIKRSYFDGVLDTSYVKVMPMNRVLNKLDIKTLLKNVNDKIADFTVKKKSKSGEPVYDEGVLVICSGMELDVADYLKKENKTGIKIDVRDITTDKKNLVFKKPPEAKIEVKAKDKKLKISVKEFYSPILMRKLEIENSKALKKEYQAKVEDFRQIIDSVAIDVDYTGKLFNAEIMDLPTKRELVKADYSFDYTKKGKYTVAVKIVDVLGEEYFETFNITA